MIENDAWREQKTEIERGAADELWKTERTKRISLKCTLFHVFGKELAGEGSETVDGEWEAALPRRKNDQRYAWKWTQKLDINSKKSDEGCCWYVQVVSFTRGSGRKQIQSHAREAAYLLVWVGGKRAGEDGSWAYCKTSHHSGNGALGFQWVGASHDLSKHAKERPHLNPSRHEPDQQLDREC